jgi:adenylate cyclase, class 2
MLEIETKIIDADIALLKKKLKELGIKRLGPVKLRRWVFDLPHKKGEDKYLRVRNDGKTSTLTYKHRKGRGLRNTEEIETEISDFDKVVKVLSKVSNKIYYQENIRETYKYKDVEITINKWPKIPAYLEIEGPSEKKIYSCIKELKIDGKIIGNISTIKLYKRYGINLNASTKIKI